MAVQTENDLDPDAMVDQEYEKQADDVTDDGDKTGNDVDQDDDLEEDAKETDEEIHERKIGERQHQKEVNKQFKKYKQAETKAEQLKRQNEELQAQLDQFKNPAPAPMKMPDNPFDPNYQEDMKNYEKNVEARKTWEIQQQQKVQQIAANRDQQFINKCVEIGISEEDANYANKTLGFHVRDPQLANYLIDDPNGPLVALYLSKNPTEMVNVTTMHPYSVGAYIQGTIIPEAQKMLKKAPKGKKPVKHVNERRVPEKGHPSLKGVKFI